MIKREILVSGYGSVLKRHGKRIEFHREGKEVCHFLGDEIDGVYVMTPACSISSAAIQLLASNNVPVAVFDERDELVSVIVPRESMEKSTLRVRQIQAATCEKGLEIAKEFVKGKLKNQEATLKYFAKSRKNQPIGKAMLSAAEKIDVLASETDRVTGDSGHKKRQRLMAHEARGAAIYWQGIRNILPSELGFTRRTRKGAKDPVNSCLNYCYAILYSKVLFKLYRVGLDPYVGFMHALADGRQALLFDFVEEFRQYFADRPLFAWLSKRGKPSMQDGRLDVQTRRKLAIMVLERMNNEVDYASDRIPAEDVILREANELADEIQGRSHHKAYIWPW